MTVGTERPLSLCQDPNINRFVGHVTGQALTISDRFMINALRLTLLCVAINAERISRFAQQESFSWCRQVWSMARQAVSATGCTMGCSGMFSNTLRSEHFEVVTIETKILWVLLDQTDVLTGMRAVTSETISVGNRRMRLRCFKRLLKLTMALETEVG